MIVGSLRCGCTCRNQTEFDPEGDGYLEGADIACCDKPPCEYIVIPDRCPLAPCDGLPFWNTTGGILSLLKDECIATESCKWTARRLIGETTLLVGRQGVDLGVSRICNPPAGDYPDEFVAQWWPGIIGRGVDPDVFGQPTRFEYDNFVPIFGCGCGVRCGWFDLYLMLVCAAGFEGMSDAEKILNDHYGAYVDWVENDTEIAWILAFNDGEATLVGHAPGGGTITYATTSWACNGRNTLTRVEDSDMDCPHWPKQVCIVPGVTCFRTPCASSQDAKDCCDPGMRELDFELASNDCAAVDGLKICTWRYNNDGNWYHGYDGELGGFIPTEFAAYIPTGECGFFFGDTIYSVNGGDRALVLFAWCDSGDWNYTLLCAFPGAPFTDISVLCEDEALTKTECCPYPQFAAIECSGLDPDSECCDEEEPPPPCCVDGTSNPTLYVSVTHSVSGFLASIPVTESGGIWTGSAVVGACTINITSLTCVSAGGYHWDLGYQITGGGPTQLSDFDFSCEPFIATFGPGAMGGSTCLGAGTLSFVVTE